jgi:hypothetical protein
MRFTGSWRLLSAGAALAIGAALIPGAAAAATGPPSHPRTAAPRCSKTALKTWLGVKGQALTGNYWYPVEITNVSHIACTTSGFRHVAAYSIADASAVGGRQVGAAARPLGKPRTVTLAPGATAHQMLDIEDVAFFTRAECHQVTAPALTFRPGGPYSVEVSFTFRACSAPKFPYMTIDPIQPGAGIPPAYN